MLARRENTILKDSNSGPSWGASYTVTVYEPGAQATSASSGTTITVARGHGFAAGDKYLLNPGSGNTFSGTDTVQSVTATTVVMGQSVSIAVGDVLVNLGPDTGTSSPNYDGSPLSIYTRMDGSDTAATSARVTCDAYGNYEYYGRRYRVWELVRNTSGTVMAANLDVHLDGQIDQFNLLDYGAVPNDTSVDNYTAIGLWIADAVNYNSTTSYPNARLYAPAGEYTIKTTGAFSNIPQPSAGRDPHGLEFVGDGKWNTLFLLSPTASDLWFYDSDTSMKCVEPTFRSIGFLGGHPFNKTTGTAYAMADISAYSKGFRSYSTGGEKGFQFFDCQFSMLNGAFAYTGTNQASENKFFGCDFSRLKGDIYSINAELSVNHHFYGCDFEILYDDFFVIGANGGGHIVVEGGSWIMQSDGVSENYFALKSDSACNKGMNTFGVITFSGVRFELDGQYSGLVYAPQVDDGHMLIRFVGCFISTDYDPSSSTPKEIVQVGPYQFVYFEKCRFYETDETNGPFNFRFKSTARYGTNGRIVFDGCQLNNDWSKRIVWDNANRYYGNAHAVNCYGSPEDEASGAIYYAADFDLSFDKMGHRDTMVRLKHVNMFTSDYSPWPSVGTPVSLKIKLPCYAVIKNIRIYKPSGLGAAVAYQLHVGNDDQTTTYGSSVPALQTAEHNIVLEDQYIELDATDNARFVELWYSGASATAVAPGGYAIVEYY